MHHGEIHDEEAVVARLDVLEIALAVVAAMWPDQGDERQRLVHRLQQIEAGLRERNAHAAAIESLRRFRLFVGNDDEMSMDQ